MAGLLFAVDGHIIILRDVIFFLFFYFKILLVLV